MDKRQRLRSTGYNGIPRGIEYKDVYHDRPDKYMYFIHAELNAILNAAAIGTSTEQCTMYLLCLPCAQCAGAIINAGIIQINYLHSEPPGLKPEVSGNWVVTIEATIEMLIEAKIVMRHING